MTNKKKMMHWGRFKYFRKQVRKTFIQNSFACKSFFGEKGHAILFQSNPFDS
jgi:hypothetical protein